MTPYIPLVTILKFFTQRDMVGEVAIDRGILFQQEKYYLKSLMHYLFQFVLEMVMRT